MRVEEKIDRLLLMRAALKAVVEDVERTVGTEAALPVAMPAMRAMDAADRMIAEMRRVA